jgi:hypothetical protein
VATDQTNLTALDRMLSYMHQHADVWQGVTYWAGGPWWGDYMFSIEPQNGIDKPQMAILMARGDTAAVSIPENTSAVTTVTATDPDAGQTLSYSISGGADASSGLRQARYRSSRRRTLNCRPTWAATTSTT